MTTKSHLACALILAAALASTGTPAEAQRAYKVKEINPSVNAASGYPNEFVEVGGVVVFSAVDGSDDRELWATDGTTAGTHRLEDINPGPASSDPLDLTLMNGVVYLAAKEATGGPRLWRTDGTEGGTYPVAPGTTWSNPSSLTVVGDALFFSAYDPARGFELWKSDGTAAGTALVKDAVPGTGSLSPNSLRNVNGVLYFSATTAATGRELWRSDGTADGTYMVRDVYAGTSDSSPVALGGLGGLAFFRAYTPAAGTELWATDGTASGTYQVLDLQPGTMGGLEYTYSSASYDGFFYFLVQQSSTSVDGLWRTDGTTAGTTRLAYLKYSSDFTLFGGLLYFTGQAGSTSQLWRTDGTVSGTFSVSAVPYNAVYSGAHSPTVVGSTIFFFGNDQLWASDGTPGNAHLVKDIAPGTPYSNMHLPGAGLGRLFFSADDLVNGQEPWVSDGTTAGTNMLKDIRLSPNGGSPSGFTELNGAVLFSANDGVTGLELWKSDGTNGGTVLLKDLTVGVTGSSPAKLTRSGRYVYFPAQATTTSSQLWRTDGTSAGTVVVGSFLGTNNQAVPDKVPDKLTDVNGTLFFAAAAGTSGVELWKTSGGWATLVKDLRSFYGSNPANLTALGNTLFFTATDNVGAKLFRTDGTEAGTVEAPQGSLPFAYPGNMVAAGGKILFSAYNAGFGMELWITDGTAAGTTMVADINSAGSSSPANFTVVDGVAYFTASDGVTGVELWKSDGTSAGTTQVADLRPGAASSNPSNLRGVGGRLFFTATDGVTPAALWSTDGTAGGTLQITDVATGATMTSPLYVADANGTALFQANDGASGAELWSSDGASGTAFQVHDIKPGAASGAPAFVTMANGRVYFAAADDVSGVELWSLSNLSPVADAGPDQTVSEGSAVTLDALASTDPDGDALTYEWRDARGVLIGRGGQISPVLPAGVHTATLIARDGFGGIATDTVVITVRANVELTLQVAGQEGGSGGVQADAHDLCASPATGTLTCSFAYPADGVAHLVALASPDSVFLGWSGACAGSATTCDVTMAAAATVGAAFRIRNHPPLGSAGGPYSGFRGRAIAFSGAGSSDPDGDPLTYAWAYGDGATGTGVSPTHEYATLGTFTVTLTVNDGTVDSAPVTSTVMISNQAPTASAGDPYAGVRHQAIAFSGAASSDPDGDVLAYAWDFGDGAAGTGVAPAHAYATVGTFTVTLTVNDGTVGSAPVTSTVTISNQAPTADAGGPYAGVRHQALALSGAASSDLDGDVLTYAWDFGDGATGSGVAPTHAYATVGTFTVTLTVNDGTVGSAPVTSTVTISNQAPTADAGGPYAGVRHQAIAFSGAASSDPDGDVLTYAWDFGDGATGTGVAPTHAYATTGTFTVTLTVHDGTTHSTAAVSTATISNRAPLANPAGPYSGTRLAAIAFNGSASSDPDQDALSYAWSFGDGSTGSGVAPTHLYATVGTFTATLTVSDGTVDSTPVSTTVQVVNLAPSVALTSPAAGSVFTAPASVPVSAEARDSDGAVSKVEFYAGTLKIGEAVGAPWSIAWSSASPGAYSLTAVVTDSSGATATSAPVAVILNAPPTVALTAPANDARYAAPATITVAASAGDADGSITRVEFFRGTTSLGVDTTSPYSVTWSGAAAGAYVLTAVAMDDRGAVVTSSSVVVKVTAALGPRADSYVRASSAKSNFGTANALTVQQGSSTSNQRWTYVKFDLTSVPTISNARVRLFGALSATTSTLVQTAVYPVSDTTWTETSLTWNNRPASGTTALATVTIVGNSTTARWYELDVTAYLRAEKAAGRNVVALALKNLANSTPYVTFSSKEATTAANRPQVLVVP